MTDPATWDEMPVTLRSGDLQRLLGIRQTTVSLWLRHGVIPGYLISHSWITFRSEVRDWVESTANAALLPRTADPHPLDSYGDVLSANDVAQLFRMSRQGVTGWFRDGIMPGIRVDRRWTVENVAIRKLLQESSNRQQS